MPIVIRPARPAEAPTLRHRHRASPWALGPFDYTRRHIESFLRHVPTFDEALVALGRPGRARGVSAGAVR